MKKSFFSLIIGLFLSLQLKAQAYELGLMGGGGNYIGDIGRETYFYPNQLGGGILFKKTINPWYSFRMNLHYFQLNANDLEANSIGRRLRRLYAEAQIYNFSIGFEYNFIPRNAFLPHQSIHKLTPYLFAGLGIGTYNSTLYRINTNNSLTGGYKYDGTNLNIPILTGLKYRLSRHFIISMEAGAYYFFTDNLDATGLYFRNMDLPGSTITPTTNLNSNDWYTFSSIGLIYTFGDLGCYFNM